jgi:hypothetical protein
VGACVLLSRLRALGAAIAGACGIAAVLLAPGEFNYVYAEGGPGWTVWVAIAGGLVALGMGAILRPAGPNPNAWAALAAAAFVLPVAVAGFSGAQRSERENKLDPGIIAAVRGWTAPGEVLFTDRSTAFLIAAYAPVYVNTSSPGHVADTTSNELQARNAAARRFFYGRRATDSNRREILARFHAHWLLIDKRRPHPDAFLRRLKLVYQDGRFALFKVHG